MKTNETFQAPIIYQPEKESVSTTSILKKKFFVWLEDSSIVKIFIAIVEMIAVGVIASMLIVPEFASAMLENAVTGYNYAFPKVVLAFVLVHWRKEILGLRKKFKRKSNQSTIEGIPKSELLHFLFETEGFKQKDFQSRFGLGRKVHERLAKKLEKAKILVRGENNARIISPYISFEEVKAMLDDAKDLSSLGFILNKTPRKPWEFDREVDKMVEEESEEWEEVKEKEKNIENPFTIRRLTVK